MTVAGMEHLRRERADKVRQIAEKRKQVEELRERRSIRAAKKNMDLPKAAKRTSIDLSRNVNDLLVDVMRGGQEPTRAEIAAAEGPLRELAAMRSTQDHGQLQVEHAVASASFEPSLGDVYDKSVQTNLTMDNQKSKTGTTGAIMGMAKGEKKRNIKPKARGKEKDKQREPAEGELKSAVTELSPADRENIMKQPDFHAFFERATLVVERALGQDTWEYLSAYDAGGEVGNNGHDVDSAELLRYIDDYAEDRWGLDRPVTDVKFSPWREEMFLASYATRKNPSLSDPDGCMLVWNLAMRSRPESVFTCQSAVLTTDAHKFDPALFFGGTYAGGVVLWDARAKNDPVQRTPLSAKSHSHPVQAMQQVGTQNATNLITASNDGRLCVWSPAMLVHPQDTIDLKRDSRRDLGVMTLSFPEQETNILYVGCEDGSVCQVHIHGQKVGVTEVYDGHDAPVTGIDMHPSSDASQSQGVVTTTDLALTCSFDWSVKLFMVKQFSSPVLSIDIFDDNIYDVRWHPNHPAVFASADGEGHLDVWNLNADLESPVVRGENPIQKRLALNHCYWSTDGRCLATGDSQGTLSVFTVDRSISQPASDDILKFQDRLRAFKPVQPRTRESGHESRHGHSHSHSSHGGKSESSSRHLGSNGKV